MIIPLLCLVSKVFFFCYEGIIFYLCGFCAVLFIVEHLPND